MPQVPLNQVKDYNEFIGWVGMMCKVKMNYGHNIIYLKKLYKCNANGPRRKQLVIFRKHAHAIYLLTGEGIRVNNCCYFKSVNSALRYYEMRRAFQRKSLRRKVIIKKKFQKCVPTITTRLETKEKLKERSLTNG